MPSIDDASVAVALGANRPSAAGSPRETLVAVRPLLEKLLRAWAGQELVYRWSSPVSYTHLTLPTMWYV